MHPWNAGIDEKNAHILRDLHQLQRVGHDLDLAPLRQGLQGQDRVFAVMKDANQRWGVRGLGLCKALSLAIVMEGLGEDAAMATMRHEGLEEPVLHHPLYRADGQTQYFRSLAGAEVSWGVLAVCHVGGLGVDGDALNGGF